MPSLKSIQNYINLYFKIVMKSKINLYFKIVMKSKLNFWSFALHKYSVGDLDYLQRIVQDIIFCKYDQLLAG